MGNVQSSFRILVEALLPKLAAETTEKQLQPLRPVDVFLCKV